MQHSTDLVPMTAIINLVPFGVGTIVFAFLAWAAKQYLGEFFKKSGASAFDRSQRRFSRSTKFGRRLVRRYAQAVERDFSKHSMGFVTGGVVDIDEVYVPLQYEVEGNRQDLYENIRQHSCSVVLGPAGAGKSLLLKNSMLMWARRAGNGQSEQVPVLIELHRCNGTTHTLTDLVVAELARSRVDKEGRVDRIQALAERGLRNGAMSLFLDGLDEVSKADRDRVFQAIRDFARQYQKCQFIVTSRDVVYNGQPLGERFSHVVRVAELDDAAVIRLLGNWRGLTEPSARAELYASLRNNPALMRLARSPLLLTMVAYLHTEKLSVSGRSLPTSRSAFYQEAITHLLGRDADMGRAGSLTVYEVAEKFSVLQRMALTTMESNSEVDRLTISWGALTKTAENLLADLNMDAARIKSLLEEIVDRSQLLVAVDKRKSHFMFRHLTLQEYLAAMELAGDPEGLLRRYRNDPLAWRETVKLWCGVSSQDSTKVIADIFASSEIQHKILALECLAEVIRVDNEFAQEIINYFLVRLGNAGIDHLAIVRALGTVAADSRPRGRGLLNQLAEIIRWADTPARADALLALSASGRPEAAQVLAPQTAGNTSINHFDDDARAALRGMGELALPVLISRAKLGFEWAADDLAFVGTPAAAVALVDLLWTDKSSSTHAAWLLASLIENPNVEEELRRNSPSSLTQSEATWIWSPFAKNKNDPMIKIAGRIGQLLTHSSVDEIPKEQNNIDPRLALPITISLLKNANPIAPENLAGVTSLLGKGTYRGRDKAPVHASAYRHRGIIRRYFSERIISGPDLTTIQVQEAIITACKLNPLHRKLISMLSWPVQATLFGTLLSQSDSLSENRIRTSDWTTVRTPRRATKALRRAFISVMTVIISGVIAIGAGRLVLSLIGTLNFTPIWLCYLLIVGFLAPPAGLYLATRTFSGFLDLISAIIFTLGIIELVALMWIGFGTIKSSMPWPTLPAMALSAIFGIFCSLTAQRRDRINNNPFRRCWEAAEVRAEDRTSVIAE
ncbi:NACHT domain-containing protein [Umezawaea sp. NPDC059074]|uniref:NACHT domain-containing protein n=1 Tax=Umezawaea sp. NPDC059074 TaxID=3346716 RepID=UPI0036ABBE15